MAGLSDKTRTFFYVSGAAATTTTIKIKKLIIINYHSIS
jgi:hypothetical protein